MFGSSRRIRELEERCARRAQRILELETDLAAAQGATVVAARSADDAPCTNPEHARLQATLAAEETRTQSLRERLDDVVAEHGKAGEAWDAQRRILEEALRAARSAPSPSSELLRLRDAYKRVEQQLAVLQRANEAADVELAERAGAFAPRPTGGSR